MEVASSAMVDSSLSRYFFKEVRSLDVRPDTILVMTGGLESVGGIEGLKEIPGIAQTPAGQNESVVDVPDSQLLSFDSQSPRAIRAIADALYGGGAGDGAGVSADKTAGK